MSFDDEWDLLWSSGPTQAEVEAQMAREGKAVMEQERAASLADWRRRNPQATCRDAIALVLLDMERSVGKA